ncbi:hypothetical protein FE257_006956 [Aspergillus nanangensis]|uniref:L-tryptophan decarboxylase PsiD-like domain-containing protein n=1 Tax=Aspergillus nanangensis TaxID=2582783 RepID=A0AAD4CNQ6_ASPNN|nr:hypothetical protein FE257_006956 [Aspergillus nanangensis]
MSGRHQALTECSQDEPSPWVYDIIREAAREPRELHPVLEELKHLIESIPRLSMLFRSMLQRPQDVDNNIMPKLRNYQHMLQVLNFIIARPPPWNVNVIIKKLLDTWGAFLQSPESATKLNSDPDGWFNDVALTNLTTAGNIGDTSYTFNELYICNSAAPHYGFQSWDAFFTRRFRDHTRPIASPDDDSIITSPCEAAPAHTQTDLNPQDTFWIKKQTYSVTDMLGPYAPKFIGGTVYQGLLRVYNYHRWHAPISGKILTTITFPGTYFSTPGALHPNLPAEVSGRVATFSGYNTAMGTRSLILIQADNPALGAVAFLAVGMAEVSTCEITIKEGDYVKKGDEIGMFHYGGSTFCIFFEKGIDVREFPDVGSETVAVRAQLAVVVTS